MTGMKERKRMFKSIDKSLEKLTIEDGYFLVCIFIIGVGVGALLVPSLAFVSHFINIFFIGVLYTVARLFSLPDEFTGQLLINYSNGDDKLNSQLNLTGQIMFLVLFIINSSLIFGKFAVDLFAINFPVLLDIKWETDWLHVSLPYLMRTIINIVQFIVMLYLSKRIKRMIRNFFNREEQIIDIYNSYTGMII